MGLLLLAAFIAVPLIEIAVFIQIGGLIGLWSTLAVVVLTAVLGTWLLRLQGIATLNRARQQLNQGAMPTNELFDGLCLVFAGALLLTPGFVTDGVGLALFVPAVRASLRGLAARHLKTHAASGIYVSPGVGPGVGPGRGPGNPGDPGRSGHAGPHRDAGVEPPPHPGRGWGASAKGGKTIDGEFRDLTDGPDGSDSAPSDRQPPASSQPDRDTDKDPTDTSRGT